MTLNIFGLRVQILKKHDLVEETNAEGWHLPETDQILIDAELVGDDFLRTLIHEMGHAIFVRTGIRQAGVPLEVEQIIVENYSICLVENFKMKLRRG